MNASSIPSAKKIIRNAHFEKAQKALEEVLEMEDAEMVSRYMSAILSAMAA